MTGSTVAFLNDSSYEHSDFVDGEISNKYYRQIILDWFWDW